jgi:hypothetical protein
MLRVQFVGSSCVNPADVPRKKQSHPGFCIEVPSPKGALPEGRSRAGHAGDGMPTMKSGDILGDQFMDEVVETDSFGHKLKKGDE